MWPWPLPPTKLKRIWGKTMIGKAVTTLPLLIPPSWEVEAERLPGQISIYLQKIKWAGVRRPTLCRGLRFGPYCHTKEGAEETAAQHTAWVLHACTPLSILDLTCKVPAVGKWEPPSFPVVTSGPPLEAHPAPCSLHPAWPRPGIGAFTGCMLSLGAYTRASLIVNTHTIYYSL